ncbi:hypothetical protein [Streptomyces sp. NPDC050856]|uniref:hypothetical protein n=1 Tax=Streptomyces sp. NPDC050856 TaxID=3154939 RepID=UPI0033F72AA6
MIRGRVPSLAFALVMGGLWWWAVLRLALVPEQSGPVEAAMAASGWGLSLLPVHVASAPSRGGSRRADHSWAKQWPGCLVHEWAERWLSRWTQRRGRDTAG